MPFQIHHVGKLGFAPVRLRIASNEKPFTSHPVLFHDFGMRFPPAFLQICQARLDACFLGYCEVIPSITIFFCLQQGMNLHQNVLAVNFRQTLKNACTKLLDGDHLFHGIKYMRSQDNPQVFTSYQTGGLRATFGWRCLHPRPDRLQLVLHIVRRARADVRVKEPPNGRFIIQELRPPSGVDDVFLAFGEVEATIAVAHAGGYRNLPSEYLPFEHLLNLDGVALEGHLMVGIRPKQRHGNVEGFHAQNFASKYAVCSLKRLLWICLPDATARLGLHRGQD